ncbi:MAG TPA: hypothetical protein P5048_02905 [Chlamydiales bacterium]|nr:hypothetical protein [Chlamydiales bacterium]
MITIINETTPLIPRVETRSPQTDRQANVSLPTIRVSEIPEGKGYNFSTREVSDLTYSVSYLDKFNKETIEFMEGVQSSPTKLSAKLAIEQKEVNDIKKYNKKAQAKADLCAVIGVITLIAGIFFGSLFLSAVGIALALSYFGLSRDYQTPKELHQSPKDIYQMFSGYMTPKERDFVQQLFGFDMISHTYHCYLDLEEYPVILNRKGEVEIDKHFKHFKHSIQDFLKNHNGGQGLFLFLCKLGLSDLAIQNIDKFQFVTPELVNEMEEVIEHL